MTMKAKTDTILRTILLVIALLNQVLVVLGMSPLPFTDEQLLLGISTVFTSITALIAWWENNSFTQKAIQADEYYDRLK